MGDIKDVPFLAEGATSLYGFLDALFVERNIGPSGKAVFSIPLALTVSKQNEFLHENILSFLLQAIGVQRSAF
jgi:hypothetical protein